MTVYIRSCYATFDAKLSEDATTQLLCYNSTTQNVISVTYMIGLQPCSLSLLSQFLQLI